MYLIDLWMSHALSNFTARTGIPFCCAFIAPLAAFPLAAFTSASSNETHERTSQFLNWNTPLHFKWNHDHLCGFTEPFIKQSLVSKAESGQMDLRISDIKQSLMQVQKA